jgi:biotin carboxyl carrier protein
MGTEQVKTVLEWMRQTDLVEIRFQEGGRGFSLSTAESLSQPNYPLPAARFTPVVSPAVGVFQWAQPGRARGAEEGSPVAEGDLLGLIETAPGKTTPVKAPCAGKLARVFAEAGKAAEYGQPLFFIAP